MTAIDNHSVNSADLWTTRLDVTAAMYAYLAAIDDRRYADAGACFSDDGALVFGETSIRTPSAIGEAIAADLGKYSMTQHVVSNAQVTLATGTDGIDTARFRGEAIGTHVWSEGDTQHMSVVGGRYNAELRHESTGWLLVTLAPTYLWTLGDDLIH